MIGTLILAALIVIVLFGAKRLLELMGAVGKSGQTRKRPKRTFTPGMKGRLVESGRRLEAAIRKEECLLQDQGFRPKEIHDIIIRALEEVFNHPERWNFLEEPRP